MFNSAVIKNKKILTVFKYFLIFILFLVFFNAKIEHTISPFAYAFLFALMWCNQSVFAIGGLYFAAQIVFLPTIEGLVLASCTVAVMILMYYIHKAIKRPMNPILVGLYSLISQIPYFYYFFGTTAQNVNLILYGFIGLLFLYAAINVLQSMILRGIYYKLTLDEGICLLGMIAIFSLGIADISVYNIELNKIIVIFSVLFLIGIGKSDYAIKLACSFGIGMALFNLSLQSLAIYVFLALVAGIFTMPNRWKISVAVLSVDIVLQLYFSSADWLGLTACISTIIAIIVYLILPTRFIYTVSDKFYLSQSELSMRNVINITRKNLYRRMQKLSDIFVEMKAIHLAMIKDSLSKDQVVNMLTNEIVQSVCADCLNKSKCHRNNSVVAPTTVSNLVEIGLNKGKINLLDIPSSLTSKCTKVNALVSKINQIVAQYSKYNSMLNNVNNVKILLAEQMGAVSKLLLNLGEEIDKNISFDLQKENKIINKLLSENIICSEVLLYTENEDDLSVMLIIKGENAYNPKLLKIVSEICKCSLRIDEIVPTENADFMSVSLKKQNKFEVVFGLANCVKQGSDKSGDSHSILRLNNNKFLLALCDGMGSGERAQTMSALTIGLIENFYKAGFDNDVVLQSVNKLLSISSQEEYSTLDICLLDLESCLADFIKVGAPYGLLKHNDNVEKIEGGALPIGVLESIAPSIFKSVIMANDIIVLATDGVTDAFKNVDDFKDFVNKIATVNPQTIAQTVLDEAIQRNDKQIKDDMTVLVARTYLNAKN